MILQNGKKAMRLCRCGYLDDPAQACTRAPRCAAEYQSKISGPLFDRIDLHVEVPAVNPADMSVPPPAEGSADIAARVAAARAVQKERYQALQSNPPIRTNAEADGKLLEEVAAPDEDGRRLLTEAAERSWRRRRLHSEASGQAGACSPGAAAISPHHRSGRLRRCPGIGRRTIVASAACHLSGGPQARPGGTPRPRRQRRDLVWAIGNAWEASPSPSSCATPPPP